MSSSKSLHVPARKRDRESPGETMEKEQGRDDASDGGTPSMRRGRVCARKAMSMVLAANKER